MSWLKLSDGYPDDPKVAAAGPLAAMLDVCGMGYAARYLTDGSVPAGAVAKLINLDGISDRDGPVTADRLADRLVEVGRWERAPGGFQIHDYLDYNPSRAQSLEMREKRQVAAKAGGKSRAGDAPRVKGRFASTTPADHQPDGWSDAGAPAGSTAGGPPQPETSPRTRTRTRTGSHAAGATLVDALELDDGEGPGAMTDAAQRRRINAFAGVLEGTIAEEAAAPYLRVGDLDHARLGEWPPDLEVRA
jgi:hypothetical protein